MKKIRLLERKFQEIASPFQSFMQDQVTASVILIACAVVALVIANSDWSAAYHSLLQTRTGLVFGGWELKESVHTWINDGLMSLFFFVLGLEIKRELLVGDLKSRRRRIPVIAAAGGGMLLPAVIYTMFNAHTTASHGWGIPMATDTAFAVGVLAMLGNRVPKSLIAFLAALAIIDDIGAILIIALVYTKSINLDYLAMAGGLFFILLLFNLANIRRPGVYLFVGAILWYAMFKSGVHASIAGILIALSVPARPRKNRQWFLNQVRKLVNRIEDLENRTDEPTPILAEKEQHMVLQHVEKTARKTTTPLQRWESGLEHPVALFVIPLFALTNAGISIDSKLLADIHANLLPVSIVVAMVLGKPLGISLFGWLTVKLSLGDLPSGMCGRHLVGIGILGGVGFTMSIFISGLSFAAHPEFSEVAKTAVLTSSLLAGTLGYIWLYFMSRKYPH